MSETASSPSIPTVCCFCGETMNDSDWPMEMCLRSAGIAEREDAPSQTLWCHGTCLYERLQVGIAFDPTCLCD